jgi:endogenous inhibitor of DNA gyrase (YacG/DUF329 family)
MTKVKCPICKKEVVYDGNEFRPFCSERCKLIDLGQWAEEKYRLPVESQSIEDLEAINNNGNGKDNNGSHGN